MSKSPAFQFYPDDFLGSGIVGTSTTEEVGIFTLLLCLDWSDTGFVFDAPRLARWCRTSEKKFLAAWTHLQRAFPEREGRHYNPRLEAEREKQRQWREKSAEGGRKSAKQRATKDEPPKEPPGKGGSRVVEPSHQPNGNTPFLSPTPVTTNNLVTSGDVTGEYPADFELLWKAYPKRSGTNNKQAAFRQYNARLKEGESFAAMHDGVLRYNAWVVANAMVGTRTVLMAASFLGRDKHYLEPYDVPTVQAAPPSRAESLYDIFTTRGFGHCSTVSEITAAIDAVVRDGLTPDRDTFEAEVRAVRPWTWMKTLRPQDKRMAVDRIAEKLRAPALAVVA